VRIVGEWINKFKKLLCALGEANETEKMIPIKGAHISGVSYRNIGDVGREFLYDVVSEGLKVRVHTTCNPGYTKEGEEDLQDRIYHNFIMLGCEESFTCTPYYLNRKIKCGDVLSWAESSAVVYANSVLGVRTNRESGITALASAILGYTPLYGLLRSEERRPWVRIKIKWRDIDEKKAGLLGYYIGEKIGRVPFIEGILLTEEEFKYLGAAIATASDISIVHVKGLTKEHKWASKYEMHTIEMKGEELREVEEKLSQTEGGEAVILGCPHLSFNELREIAEATSQIRRVKKRALLFTSRAVYSTALSMGYIEKLRRKGFEIYTDSCVMCKYVEELEEVYTNSVKAAFYLYNRMGIRSCLKSTREIIQEVLLG